MTRMAIMASLSATLLSFGASNPAVGQGMPAGMADALQRKYDILQQQADTQRVQAETERSRAQAEANAYNRSGTQNYQSYAVPAGDALAGTDAPSYTLGNGATIRVSGGLAPSEATSGDHPVDPRRRRRN